MLTRLAAASRKELLSFLRDPKTRMFLLVAPIMQVIIFAFAATLEVRNVDIAVFDQDPGRWSQEFTARVAAATFVGELRTVHSLPEIYQLVRTRDVAVGLHFAPDFSRRIVAENAGAVQVLIDGRRANSGQITLSYLNQIAADLNSELLLEEPAGASAMVRHWFNPNLEYRWFIVPCLSALMSLIMPLMMTCLSIAREREMGTYEQLLVSPLTPLETIVSKILPAIGTGLFLCIAISLIAVLFFRVPFAGNPLYFLFGITVFMFSIVGIGLTISALCQTQQQAILGTFMCMQPVTLTSGFVTPVENMPGWLQVAAQANPLKHILVIVQGSYLKSMPFADVWANTWPMLVIGVVTLSAATVLVRRHHP